MAKTLDLRSLDDRYDDEKSLDLDPGDGGPPIRFLPPESWPEAALAASDAAAKAPDATLDSVNRATFEALFGPDDWGRLVAFWGGASRATRKLAFLHTERHGLTVGE